MTFMFLIFSFLERQNDTYNQFLWQGGEWIWQEEKRPITKQFTR